MPGNDFSDTQTTQAPLARPHAAAPESLGLIGSQTTECDVLANLTGADFLATADNHLVGGNAVLLLRAVQGIDQWPCRTLLAQGLSIRHGEFLQALPVDFSRPCGNRQPSQATFEQRHLNAADGTTVTRDKNSRQAGFTPAVTACNPAQLLFAPVMFEAQRPTDLGVGHHTLMQQNQGSGNRPATP